MQASYHSVSGFHQCKYSTDFGLKQKLNLFLGVDLYHLHVLADALMNNTLFTRMRLKLHVRSRILYTMWFCLAWQHLNTGTYFCYNHGLPVLTSCEVYCKRTGLLRHTLSSRQNRSELKKILKDIYVLKCPVHICIRVRVSWMAISAAAFLRWADNLKQNCINVRFLFDLSYLLECVLRRIFSLRSSRPIYKLATDSSLHFCFVVVVLFCFFVWVCVFCGIVAFEGSTLWHPL